MYNVHIFIQFRSNETIESYIRDALYVQRFRSIFPFFFFFQTASAKVFWFLASRPAHTSDQKPWPKTVTRAGSTMRRWPWRTKGRSPRFSRLTPNLHTKETNYQLYKMETDIHFRTLWTTTRSRSPQCTSSRSSTRSWSRGASSATFSSSRQSSSRQAWER